VAAETADAADLVTDATALPAPEPFAGLADDGAAVVAAETAELTVEAAGAEAAGVDGVAAGLAPESLPEEADDVAAPVAAETAEPTVDVAADAADAEVAGGVVPGSELGAADGGAGAADPPTPVADDTAEVADEAVDVTVEVTADVGESDACACFDSPIKTTTTPTVKIAIWTARRAMCRNVG
jgi:hypothetical protein